VTAWEWLDYGGLLEGFSLGANLPRLRAQPLVYIGPEHEAVVDRLSLPQRYCVIHRQSNSPAKDWSDEKWAALASVVRDELGLPIVEIGYGQQPLVSPLGTETISLFNRLALLQTAEVVRRASLFIGVDSGPAHFANAARTPGVVLLGRLLNFRYYNPFTGFYASNAPDVKMARNLMGPASQLTVDEVAEAIRYVARVPATRSATRERQPLQVAPGTRHPKRELVLACGLFDPAWYLTHNPDAQDCGLDPVDHYLFVGSAEGREPSVDFSAQDYRDSYPDIVRAGVDPLVHYFESGVIEERHRIRIAPEPEEGTRTDRAEAHLPAQALSELLYQENASPPLSRSATAEMPRVFAFYLPQFHPIAENNWAHGMGFTEWNNVLKAKPLFRGHYQPRQPGELGYYDLRSTEVLEAQVALAQEHGIDGFCFYYYYFQGKKLLFTPLHNYIKSSMKAPFFLLWANENWSKRWDGGDQEIIIAQHHSKEDDIAFITEMVSFFRDERYVKINGKPLLMIYKSFLFPDIRATCEIWRTEVEKLGFPGLYLVMVDDWAGQAQSQPRDHGFDAAYEIPSNLVPPQVLASDVDSLDPVDGFEGRIVDYRKFARYHAARPFPEYKRFRTVMLPWDNTARYGQRAMVHIHGDGDAYRLWLLQALLDTHARYEADERLVFLHSWNEWCEGTYLEPDQKWGRFFLEETRGAIRTAREAVALGGRASAGPISDMLRMQRMKDEGAFYLLHAARQHTNDGWAEAERRREQILTLEAKIFALENPNGKLKRKAGGVADGTR
jgi:hypothetical protein